MTAARGFARHLSGIDPRTETPPAGLLAASPRALPVLPARGRRADDPSCYDDPLPAENGRDSGACLHRFAWVPIVRHQTVKGAASLDDPALTGYWANRRRKSRPPLSSRTLRVLQAQDGRPPLCRDCLLYADHQPQSASEWEQWLRTTQMAIRSHHIGHWERHGRTDDAELHLVHAYCRRRTAAQTAGTAPLPACQP